MDSPSEFGANYVSSLEPHFERAPFLLRLSYGFQAANPNFSSGTNAGLGPILLTATPSCQGNTGL
jgi:hypothetical protein